MSRNLGTLTSWNPLGLSRPVMGLLYHYFVQTYSDVFKLAVGCTAAAPPGNFESKFVGNCKLNSLTRYVCLIHCPVSRTQCQSFIFRSSTALVGQGFLIIEESRSHSGTQLSIGHLWTRERSAVQTSIWQYTLTKGQTSMPPTGFEPAVPAIERPYPHILDHAATGINHYQWLPRKHKTNSGYPVTSGSNVVPVIKNSDFRGKPEICDGHLCVSLHAQHSLSISCPVRRYTMCVALMNITIETRYMLGYSAKKKLWHFFQLFT